MELFKSRTRVAYTNAVGDKVYPVVVDIKKGIKSTEDIQFVSSDVNTGILSVAFIQGNDNYNVTGADVVCSVMRPDASTLELPCEVVRENIVEVPLGINGTSQDGVYSFDFKVLKGGNKVVGTPIMNYSVSLSIGNDMVVEEDDRLPVLTMLMTQVNELKGETSETINQANIATEASKEATANAIEATNNANAVSERVSQETATAISEIKQDTENAIASMSQTTSTAISTMNQNTTDAIASMTQKTNEAVTRVNDSLTNINNTVATKVSELDTAKSDMTNTVSNKIQEVETRFNTLTSAQQQDAEVIDARDGETSLKARLDRDVEKAKQVYVGVEGSNISTDSSVGYLKDVEILGNTIQDASNLADIRSVGDKVEGQELYEIPVLSVGKNLFDKENFSESTKVTKKINLLPNTTYYIYTSNPMANGALAWLHEYNANGDKITNGLSIWQSGKFTTKDETVNVHFNSSVDFIDTFVLSTEPITEYEPYQEDKLTILSPVQLEKVGNVRDRIIEKDGVWGVEKNVETIIVTSGNTINKSIETANHIRFDIILPNLTDGEQLICNRLVWEHSNNDKSHCWQGVSQIAIFIPKVELETYDVEGCKKWIDKQNELFFMKATKTSQFTPLPHDQQVKLRTFANKTNISFLTEIEGTIKAQVPKSLGATVNTHTEQINNLNKELDRVKKLEESTVSTVTTESDFTTVEATSNGYFEDVKLEGKTLVNLLPSETIKNVQKDNENFIITDTWLQLGIWDKTPIKPNTTYTIIVNVIEKPNNVSVRLQNNSNYIGVGNTPQGDMSVGINVFTSTTTSVDIVDNTSHNYLGFMCSGFTEGQRVVISKNMVLLEGDHTQNPPNGYIEGLKSVGQGTDEIVVSSVYNKRNLIDLKTVNQDWGGGKFETNISSNNLNYHSCEAFDVSFLRNKQIYGGLFRDGVLYSSTMNFVCIFGEDKKQIGDRFSFGNAGYIVPSNAKYMRLMCYSGSGNTLEYINRDKYCISLIPFKDKEPYTPHISDKKRLLYYNNETQTWEKPILREWDSIEKHSDGKYYYHKRSEECVLDGNVGTFNVSVIENNDYIRWYRATNTIIPKAKVGGRIICDTLNNETYAKLETRTCEGIGIKNQTPTDLGVTVLKSRYSATTNTELNSQLASKPITFIYEINEEVYECTNIDLITCSGETNYIVESGAIVPKSTLKVHNNISNVVSLLQKKVSLLESNVKASQEVQDMMILETDMRMLDIELALMEFAPMKLNLGGSDMLRSATYFNFLKNHIINETYEKGYLENVMNKYLATGRINQDEYDELYNMLYPPVYDIELPIEP